MARAEWVLTLYTGTSQSYASSLHVTQAATRSSAWFDGVSWTAHPFSEGAPYYGLRLSYFPPARDHLGALLDFTHYKMYAQSAQPVTVHGIWNGAPVNTHAPLGAFVQHLQLSHGVNLTSLSAEYRWNPRFEEGPWQTHVGGGALIYLPHGEGIVDHIAVSNNYQYAGGGGQLFAGAEYALPPRLMPWRIPSVRVALLVESKLDVGHIAVDLDPGTRASLTTTTVHLIAGVSIHFQSSSEP